jgi:hypothetical protein
MPKAKKKTPAKIFDEGEPKFGNVSGAEEFIEIPVPTEEQKAAMIEFVDELAKSKLCNHRNLHAQPEALCVLDPGHSGNHSDGKSEWSDAAGTPPRRHA